MRNRYSFYIARLFNKIEVAIEEQKAKKQKKIIIRKLVSFVVNTINCVKMSEHYVIVKLYQMKWKQDNNALIWERSRPKPRKMPNVLRHSPNNTTLLHEIVIENKFSY